MTPSYGIDTSILVRLVTGEPTADFEKSVVVLTRMVEREGAQIFASNMVIGEAYMALQHHYGVTKPVARSALRSVLTSGLVQPLHGQPVLDALVSRKGCGLLDRLIAGDYQFAGLTTLTLDRKMASLPSVKRLQVSP